MGKYDLVLYILSGMPLHRPPPPRLPPLPSLFLPTLGMLICLAGLSRSQGAFTTLFSLPRFLLIVEFIFSFEKFQRKKEKDFLHSPRCTGLGHIRRTANTGPGASPSPLLPGFVSVALGVGDAHDALDVCIHAEGGF